MQPIPMALDEYLQWPIIWSRLGCDGDGRSCIEALTGLPLLVPDAPLQLAWEKWRFGSLAFGLASGVLSPGGKLTIDEVRCDPEEYGSLSPEAPAWFLELVSVVSDKLSGLSHFGKVSIVHLPPSTDGGGCWGLLIVCPEGPTVRRSVDDLVEFFEGDSFETVSGATEYYLFDGTLAIFSHKGPMTGMLGFYRSRPVALKVVFR